MDQTSYNYAGIRDLKLRPVVLERHEAFVRGYKAGAIAHEVDLRTAYNSTLKYNLNSFRDVEGVVQTLFSWLNLLCFPGAIAAFIWVDWRIGVGLLAAGIVGWPLDRAWMRRLVVKKALRDPGFFGHAVDLGAIVLAPEFERWDGSAFDPEEEL